MKTENKALLIGAFVTAIFGTARGIKEGGYNISKRIKEDSIVFIFSSVAVAGIDSFFRRKKNVDLPSDNDDNSPQNPSQ